MQSRKRPITERHPTSITRRVSESRNAVPKQPRLIGYARVSTDGQTIAAQEDALRAAGCAEIYADEGVSGALTSRPQLNQCLAQLRSGDTLVVTSLSRLGRSMPHLVATVHELQSNGVAFRSLTEALDSGSATGRFMLHLFAALADFERELARERTRSTLRAKKARGERLGRRPALTPQQVQAARKLLAEGEKPTHVAHLFRIGKTTLYRHLDLKNSANAPD